MDAYDGELVAAKRTGRVERVADDTKALVEINLDGSGATDIETGVAFFDHALDKFGRYAGFDLTVHTIGGARSDPHYHVEGSAIALGEAFAQSLSNEPRRVGDALVPEHEALVQVAVDLGGHPFLAHDEPAVMETALIGVDFPATMVRHIWESFALHAGCSLHIRVLAGREPHHIASAQFKAVACALRAATGRDAVMLSRASRE